MITHKSEILLYYNPDSSTDRMTVAHAMGISRHIKAYAYHQCPSTGVSWQQIITALKKHPKELLNKAHPYYQQYVRDRDFDEEGWIKVLRYNPEIILAPIAVRGKQAVQCLTPTDIYKLGS